MCIIRVSAPKRTGEVMHVRMMQRLHDLCAPSHDSIDLQVLAALATDCHSRRERCMWQTASNRLIASMSWQDVCLPYLCSCCWFCLHADVQPAVPPGRPIVLEHGARRCGAWALQPPPCHCRWPAEAVGGRCICQDSAVQGRCHHDAQQSPPSGSCCAWAVQQAVIFTGEQISIEKSTSAFTVKGGDVTFSISVTSKYTACHGWHIHLVACQLRACGRECKENVHMPVVA